MLTPRVELKKVPDELEAHLSAKHFVRAVSVLNAAASMANQPELLEIAALNDIRQYLKAQSVSLVEILIEELHNHLYLKSPYCDPRWMTYISGQSDLPVVQETSDAYSSNDAMPDRKHSSMGRLAIESHRAKTTAERSSLEIAGAQHPEVDSFQYIRVIIEALYAVGKLPYSLDLMIQRLPIEVHQTVERTIGEVRNRHRDAVTTLTPLDPLAADVEDNHHEPLRDLLWTLFSKWDALLQSHRLLYDTVIQLQDRSIVDKRGTVQNSALNYDFSDIWKPLESELRSILNDYLTEQSSSNQGNNADEAIDDLFGSRQPRDKTVPVFSILHTATSAQDTNIAADELQLRQMLQGSVPGLLPEQNDSAPRLLRQSVSEGSAQHFQLVPPSAFNISVLLQPTVAFLNRAKRILPSSPRMAPGSIMSFLDEFLENVFAPQISESVDELYKRTMEEATSNIYASGTGTRQAGVSSHTERVLDLIFRLNQLLSTIPYNRQGYSHTILKLIGSFYQHSHAWLTSLTANEFAGNGHLGSLKLGAAWAHRPIIRDLWINYFAREPDLPTLNAAAGEEIRALCELKKGFSIKTQDLMQDSASFETLIMLYKSLRHFTSSLLKLRPQQASKASDAQILLMLPEAITHFDTLIKSYNQLANMILLIIRIEIRCHILYYLQLSLGQGNYNIEEPASEVDSALADLNTDLVAICQPASTLPEADYSFVMSGVAELIDTVLIEDSDQISIMSTEGATKLSLGITSLQQNLRNLVLSPDEADLSKSKNFYDLFKLGPLGLADAASKRDLGIDFGQATKLMKLQYSLELGNDITGTRSSRDSVSAKRRQLNDHLALLASSMAQQTTET